MKRILLFIMIISIFLTTAGCDKQIITRNFTTDYGDELIITAKKHVTLQDNCVDYEIIGSNLKGGFLYYDTSTFILPENPEEEVVNILNTLSNMMLTKKLLKYIGNGININEVCHGDKIDAIGMNIEFFDIESTKDKQFGFKAILPNEKKLVCLGDEPYKEISKRYVENCDWLLSEAFCLYEDREIFKPYEKNHSTPIEAGKLAKELNVENLILYHTDKRLRERKRLYSEEAKTVYDGQVFVPYDLERIELK